MTTYNV